MVFYGKLVCCTNCIYSFQAKPGTLKYKFIYVSLCWRNIVLIMSDKSTRPTKLSHDAGESKSLWTIWKKTVLWKTITLENVFSVSAYTIPFTGVCKRFIFLISNFTIHYSSCAQHFLRLIFASAICEYEYIN